MRFDLNDEQKLLQQTAREFFAAESPMSHVREQFDEQRFDRDLWQAMAEQGWLGVLVDDEHGGLGLGLADMEPILEEAGRALAPVPLVEGAVIAPLIIRNLAGPALAAEWLPALVDGKLLVTQALYEDPDLVEPTTIGVSARQDGDGWVLDGAKDIVAFGADADLVLVLARTDPSQRGLGRLTLFAVPASSGGLSRSAQPHADATYRFARLEFQSVRVPGNHVLGPVGGAHEALRPIVRAARVAICADTVGGCTRVVDMSAEYAKQRVQFDRPIGSFQAMKHKLADMWAAAERIKGLTYAAAAAFDAGNQDDPIAEVAKATCDEAYRFVTSEGIQVHGGIGFTWEHDVHFFYKRALRYSVTLGSAQQMYSEVGERLARGEGWTDYEPAESPVPVAAGAR